MRTRCVVFKQKVRDVGKACMTDFTLGQNRPRFTVLLHIDFSISGAVDTRYYLSFLQDEPKHSVLLCKKGAGALWWKREGQIWPGILPFSTAVSANSNFAFPHGRKQCEPHFNVLPTFYKHTGTVRSPCIIVCCINY